MYRSDIEGVSKVYRRSILPNIEMVALRQSHQSLDCQPPSRFQKVLITPARMKQNVKILILCE